MTSFVVMIVPLLLTTIIGELLLLGRVAVTGLGRILLGWTCCVIILTPRKKLTALLADEYKVVVVVKSKQTSL